MLQESKTRRFPVLSICGLVALRMCCESEAKSNSPRQSESWLVKWMPGTKEGWSSAVMQGVYVGVLVSVRSIRTFIPMGDVRNRTRLAGENLGPRVTGPFIS